MKMKTLHGDDSSAMNDRLMPPMDTSSASIDTWDNVRFFPFAFEEYCFTHWYVLLLVVYLAALLLGMLYDVQNKTLDFSDGFEFSLTKFILTDWPLISLIVAIILTVLAFNRWRGSVPTTFKLLHTRKCIGSLNQECDVAKEYHAFLLEYKDKLLSNKRYVVIAISMGTCSVLFFMMASVRNFPPSALGFTNSPLYYVIVWTFWILLPALGFGYFFGVGAWIIIITGQMIKGLTLRFDLKIHPGHPDQCGGLKALGVLCFGMALPILIGATLLGIYGIGGIIDLNLTRGLIIIPIAANIFLFLFALPLAAVAFFVPLWNIHVEMQRRREKYEDEFAERVAKLEQKLRESLDNGNLKEAKFAKEEMEIVQVLHPDTIGYPLWPFDRRIRLTLLSTQIIPTLSLIIGLSNQWLKH